MRLVRYLTDMERRNAYNDLVGKSEGKKPLERPRLRSEDNIKMDPREVGLELSVCIHIAQDRSR
jgi:hypothetical protein